MTEDERQMLLRVLAECSEPSNDPVSQSKFEDLCGVVRVLIDPDPGAARKFLDSWVSAYGSYRIE